MTHMLVGHHLHLIIDKNVIMTTSKFVIIIIIIIIKYNYIAQGCTMLKVRLMCVNPFVVGHKKRLISKHNVKGDLHADELASSD